MLRRGARDVHLDDAPVGTAPVTFSGSIRSAAEDDALGVDLTVSSTEITLNTDGATLGTWPASDVIIRPLDSTTFEFIAEGDRLLFTPDDPATFRSGLPDSDSGDGTRKRRRRTSKKESPGTAQTPRDESPAAVETPPDTRPDHEEQGSDSDETHRKGSRERLSAAWLRSLDVARRYDLLGLDRVPIDESNRGEEHEHTWDHRVAATSGAGKHICTICGKIRR